MTLVDLGINYKPVFSPIAYGKWDGEGERKIMMGDAPHGGRSWRGKRSEETGRKYPERQSLIQWRLLIVSQVFKTEEHKLELVCELALFSQKAGGLFRIYLFACTWTRRLIKPIPVATLSHVTGVTCDRVPPQVWNWVKNPMRFRSLSPVKQVQCNSVCLLLLWNVLAKLHVRTSPHLAPYNHQHRQFTEKQAGHGHMLKNKLRRVPKDITESSALYKLPVLVFMRS